MWLIWEVEMERMHVGTIWIVLAVLALGAWSCDSEDDSGARDGTSSGGTDGANNTDGDGSSTNTLDDSSSSQDTDTGDTSDITSPTTALRRHRHRRLLGQLL